MRVGVPTETKLDEYRVALTPAGTRELAIHGHDVIVQAGAGEGSAVSDEDYESQGARIVPDAEAVFAEAELLRVLGETVLSEHDRTRQHADVLARLQEADAAKDRFLAMVSSELRGR